MSLVCIKPGLKPIDQRIKGPETERITGSRHSTIRDRIILRDESTCQACHRVCSLYWLEIDHIIPLHMGGAESDENRQTLCKACHRAKTSAEEKERRR